MGGRTKQLDPEEEDLRLWSAAILAGIPNELFWELTPFEVHAVLERQAEKEKGAYLRAGLVAATIVNVHRAKGARLVQPGDFLKERPKPEDYMDPELARSVLDRWAASTNPELVKEVVSE